MDFFISIYLKAVLACTIWPIGIFFLFGTGSNKRKNLIVTFSVIVALWAITLVGGYFPALQIVMLLCGVFSLVVLFTVCADCIMTAFDDGTSKKKRSKKRTCKSINVNTVFSVCALLFIIKSIILAVLSIIEISAYTMLQKIAVFAIIFMALVLGALLTIAFKTKKQSFTVLSICVYLTFTVILSAIHLLCPVGLTDPRFGIHCVFDIGMGITCLYYSLNSPRKKK